MNTASRPTPRTRLLRGNSNGAAWELWIRTPHPALRGLAIELWGGLVSAFARHRVLPNGEVSLMFHLGAPQRVTERGGAARDDVLHHGFVSGLQEAPSTFETIASATRVVTARLAPLGAWRLLGGLPQTNLTGEVIDVGSVLDARSGVRELHERLGDAANLGRALECLECWLLARLQDSCTPHPATRQALHLLETSRGRVQAAALARECGVSARRLRELLLRETGLPPKRLARILRFRNAIGRIAGAPHTDLRELALDCGYYDQPHLNHEFRALSAMTPGEYLAAIGDDPSGRIDGPDVIGG